MVSVLVSALVKRFSVSRMQDLLTMFMAMKACYRDYDELLSTLCKRYLLWQFRELQLLGLQGKDYMHVLRQKNLKYWWTHPHHLYMGGTSQDVKRLKKSGIFILYTFGFLDHLHFICYDENYHVS